MKIIKISILLFLIFNWLVSKAEYFKVNTDDNISLKNSSTNNFKHKYFINNCYYGIGAKKIIYQNTNILNNGIDYGLNNYISVGTNILLYVPSSFLNLHLNSQIDLNEYLKFGVAYNIFFIADNINGEKISGKKFELLSGGITIGNEMNNITFTLAKGYIQKLGLVASINEDYNNLAFSISGMVEVEKNFYFITDNFFMNKIDEKFFSLGVRKTANKFSYDFALMGNTFKKENDNNSLVNGGKTFSDAFIVYPYLSINYLLK